MSVCIHSLSEIEYGEGGRGMRAMKHLRMLFNLEGMWHPGNRFPTSVIKNLTAYLIIIIDKVCNVYVNDGNNLNCFYLFTDSGLSQCMMLEQTNTHSTLKLPQMQLPWPGRSKK